MVDSLERSMNRGECEDRSDSLKISYIVFHLWSSEPSADKFFRLLVEIPVSFQSRGAADDLGQFTSNLRLPGSIVEHGKRLDHIVGVFSRPPHGDHSRDLLAD